LPNAALPPEVLRMPSVIARQPGLGALKFVVFHSPPLEVST
jgi:hypothetical protein